MEKRSFNSLVEQSLGRRLPDALAERVSMDEMSPESRGVTRRLLTLMQRAACPATEFTPHMIWLLSTVTPGMLPPAWGGRIPPVTAPGRHRKLDTLVSRRNGSGRGKRPVFVDLGCGFPPLTTVDTARHLPDWSVFGVDRSFAPYVLYDAADNYACFGADGSFQYFQPQMKPLHENPAESRARFESLFKQLSPALNTDNDGASLTVEKNGNRLVRNHIRDFEDRHLRFIEADIEVLQVPPARSIRCMNVLLYFEKSLRDRLRSLVGSLLDYGGELICGFNHPAGIYARYAIYKRETHGASPVEFAFSPDNLRPLGIGPFLTIQEEDEEAELLADLTGAIRADPTFWPGFHRFVDTQRSQLGICRRGKDGYNQFPPEAQSALPPETMRKTAELWRWVEAAGYVDGAVAALSRAGYKVWKNPVGDIAVLPPEGSLPAM